MDIHLTPFDKEFVIHKNGQKIVLKFWQTDEECNIKIGVNAPRNMAVDREEIWLMKKEQKGRE